MRIRTFQGLVPSPGKHADIASVPYDVVNREEAAALGDGKPENFIHVVRAEIDLPEVEDPYSDEVYAKSRDTLERFQADGVLVREDAPAIYLYQQTMGDHTQTGIVAVSHVDDYAEDKIKKHEKTRPAKEDDRTRITSELGANTGPVFLTYEAVEEIDALVAQAVEQDKPVCQFHADDGVEHVVWKLSGERAEQIVSLFGDIPVTYVADGHHRSASAHRVGAERRAANPNHDGTEDYNYFLSVLYPGNQLKILPYNRAIHDLNGLTEDALLEGIRAAGFEITADASPAPSEAGSCSMFLGGAWHQISWAADPSADVVARLDVSVLQDRILTPLLGIDDPRTSNRIDFVGGIRGTAELERLVEEGRAAVCFAVHPVSVEELMAIADAGQIMAPKCTWFEPKLRSGLFVHTF